MIDRLKRLDVPTVGPDQRAWLGFWLFCTALVMAAALGLLRATPFDANDPVFTSPRQSVTWATAQAWAESGRPAIIEPGLTELPDGLGPALTPRDGASLGNEILPKDFPLTVAAYAVALKINPWAAYVLNPLQGILLLAAVGTLTWVLSSSRPATAFSMALLLTVPAFWSNAAVGVATDVAGAAALLFGVSCLIKSRDRESLTVVAGLLFGIAVATRYTHIGPAAAAITAALVTRTITLRQAVSTSVSLALSLSPILAYHAWLYGGPITTGYAIGDALFTDRLRFAGRGLLSFSGGRFTSHLRFYALRPESLVLIAGTVVAARHLWKRREGRAVILFGCVTASALFFYHGGQGTWGSTSFAVNASLMRYLLPVTALAASLAGIGAARLRPFWPSAIGTAVVALLVTSALTTAWEGRGGFLSANDQRENQRLAADWVRTNIPPDAVTISRLGSKTYFPDRPVLTATLMLRGNKVITDREILVWEAVPSVPELAADLITLHQGGYDVFVENDGNEPWLDARDLSHLNRELRPAGIKLVRLPASPNSALLHLVALASTPPPQG